MRDDVRSRDQKLHAGWIVEGERLRLHAALDLIMPANSLEHSGGTLWSHLIGTYEILNAWGAPSEVCLAGALHSIYATQYFTSEVASKGRRGEIARTVGRRAEGLAYAFCILDREGIRNAAVMAGRRSGSVSVPRHSSLTCLRVAGSIVKDLRLIDLANEVEQRQRLCVGPTPGLAELACAFREISFRPAALPPEALTVDTLAEGVLLSSYAQALEANKEQASNLLAQCVMAVPCCAEPRLLLAVAHLEAGRLGAAYSNSSIALAHLRGWAAAWDTCVPLLAWEYLALQLIDAARRGEIRPPPIALQIKAQLRRGAVRRP